MSLFKPQRFLGFILLTLASGNLLGQHEIVIRGYGAEGIDFNPPVIFATVNRGAVQETAIEITNRRTAPLNILDVVNPSQRFKARVETLDEGRRYRLMVTLKGEGPAGKQQDILELKTNLEDTPVFRIPVNTFVREKVRTFPDSVFMGRYPLSEIRDNPATAKQRAQILMVYREDTTDFQITVSSDVPYLKISSERGPKGDRYENTIWIDPDLAQAGKIKGNIIIKTNDPDFPELMVPVTGDIQPK